MKVNVNAGLDAEGVDLGVVVRDHAGNFVLAAAKRMKDIKDPTMGEALAVEFGLQLVRQHHIAAPMVESDCLTVVNSTNGTVEVETEVGIVYRNIKNLLGEFENGSLRHVSRKANEAAHIMAHTMTRWNRAEVWFDRPPLNLLDQLVIDNVDSVAIE
ncbi:unnamed protein product [Linum trigynum]|uniref:RNase H type-1 domain-containing protein n=1 Tax=Linum trigynum TaxID=586398 RepID=A0AAV2D678_9ROSI